MQETAWTYAFTTDSLLPVPPFEKLLPSPSPSRLSITTIYLLIGWLFGFSVCLWHSRHAAVPQTVLFYGGNFI